ncbi:MAG TPA: sigma factor-like helix-turn-helix DNA-binding protein [Terriglobales bacterium]|nr:sigma factor-like helix-turn-helix DNA-binding protein [Terriglobales bacterium]
MATLISLLGDFDLAEEYAQEAFTAALGQWAVSGVPESPRAWIITTAHHKAIDRLRRQTLFAEKLQPQLAREMAATVEPEEYAGDEIPDERLRLMFTCCHPSLASEAQVALTLRTLCGLETDEIARAFVVPVATMAQRLVRAKRKIRDARIPYLFRPLRKCRSGSMRFSPSSTWCSTKGTRQRAGSVLSARICVARQSACAESSER